MGLKFRHAIVRPPAAGFETGLTSVSLGKPRLPIALEQHRAYCAALEQLGVTVHRIPGEPSMPDATFVEDTALLLPGLSILTRPGAPSRRKEVAGIAAALERRRAPVAAITKPGTVDAGDVLWAGRKLFVGLSARTNAPGLGQLTALAKSVGIETEAIEVAASLHLKSSLTLLDENTLLTARWLAGHPALEGFRCLAVPDAEAYAANAIAVNGTILIAEGFPETRKLLERTGYSIQPLAMSEFMKQDGGLSCLSLRW